MDQPQHGLAPSQHCGLSPPAIQTWPDPRQFVGKIWVLAVIVAVHPPTARLLVVVVDGGVLDCPLAFVDIEVEVEVEVAGIGGDRVTYNVSVGIGFTFSVLVVGTVVSDVLVDDEVVVDVVVDDEGRSTSTSGVTC